MPLKVYWRSRFRESLQLVSDKLAERPSLKRRCSSNILFCSPLGLRPRLGGNLALDRNQPSVLVMAAKWWPLSARLAVALHRHGCEVSAVCPAGHPLTHVSGIRRIYRYGGISSLSSVRRALEECRPDAVIPCDDGVVAQLHALHELDPSLRPLIERSLGPPESYSVVESRHRFLSRALDLVDAILFEDSVPSPRLSPVRGH